MVNLLLLLLSAGFFTVTIAAVMLTLFRRSLAFDKRVTMYFGDISRPEVAAAATKNKTGMLSGLLKFYWEKGILHLNKKVSRTEKKKLDSLLRDAGHPFKSAAEFRLFQMVLGAGAGAFFAFLMVPNAEKAASGWMLAFTVALLGFRLPVFFLGKKATARVKQINKDMPDFFDTVNLLLEAGMGLDLALAEVSRKLTGPLADEFKQALEDMKLGMSRREAFYELRKRVPSDSFQSVINSLIQADQLGIGMAKVLGNVTRRVREQRREAAREQAMKAPVKMLFPMVFFIFPSLFIVILGPLVITLVTKGLGG
ncbi:type II secretion system F family protein [Bacillus sp. FJAT-27251]|uniref:type II secretion system F family protein n=1 Tax=Bacillus sp. FJAT-27251 TaxID=1684142 RepID=UPI0006A766E8|nr:type II secretion system F family protein [Bacillus sp. FJAT-27251]